MSKVTMIGCDLHEATLVLKVAVGQEESVRKTFAGRLAEDLSHPGRALPRDVSIAVEAMRRAVLYQGGRELLRRT